MKKIWLIVGLLWLISVVYFIVYVNDIALRMAVNTNTGMSLLHSAMDVVLLGGGFALILHFIQRIRHPK